MNLNSKQMEVQLEKQRILERNLTFRISVMSRLLDQQGAELLSDAPIGLTAYRLLKIVETFEQVSISDISRHMLADRAQISRTAMDLAKRGYVSFRADPGSKRKKMVALSTTGIALLGDLTPRFDRRRDELISLLGPETLDRLWDAIDKITHRHGQ